MQYPKRLIEVDLPIRRISAHARREKSIRHGHISTLHIWWARRPLAACRAVVCASLWPDPCDAHCPRSFINAAQLLCSFWAQTYLGKCSEDSYPLFARISKDQKILEELPNLRAAILDFIADFANWDNACSEEYVLLAQAMTVCAHAGLSEGGGAQLSTPVTIDSLRGLIDSSTRPLVVDPFAGGGAIPLESLRCGGDSFASDLNPIPVLLNKVALEYIPKYGTRLASELLSCGRTVRDKAFQAVAGFYPQDDDNAKPIAYIWARTITCEGPGCGTEVPLIRSLWLSKKSRRPVTLEMIGRDPGERPDFRILLKEKRAWVDQDDPKRLVDAPQFDGTVKRGSATCPCCGYTTPVARVREQLKVRHGGSHDARLLCVVTTRPGETGRFYRLPTSKDTHAADSALDELRRITSRSADRLTALPDEELDVRGIRHTWAMLYGLSRWCDYFTPRQALSLLTLIEQVKALDLSYEEGLSEAIAVCLALAVGKQADRDCSLCRWIPQNENIGYTFGRQALGMMWDFVEAPWLASGGGWDGILRDVARTIELQSVVKRSGHAEQCSATAQVLPDDAAAALVTDPPYYDSVPYAHLSDFFYVWLRRVLGERFPDMFMHDGVPKAEEIVVDRPHELSDSNHDVQFYERELCKAFAESRRIVQPDGIGTIVFASKSTSSWEAILKAVIDANWVVTGSWPIDTEREARIAAQGQARLGSSVHLVCRPRERPDGSVDTDCVGQWRDVLAELPTRIGQWLPRLSSEGVVGADAIFACLGPALEIFSRYSAVEKTSGEEVELREYLVQVWAEVAQQALNMIFEGADTAGLEEDARLTAMWLWTLRTDAEADVDAGEKVERIAGYELEYDAARKIAQGLGCHLEKLSHLVESKGETATLLSAASRARYLFGKEDVNMPKKRGKQKTAQGDLFAALDLPTDEALDKESAELDRPAAGKTTLDQLHQAMILFGAGRGAALKRFLVDDGVGTNAQLWSLAQSLTALYPPQSEEKRWVDGVLARKKGLGF
jgi:putative DNA methylase